MAACCRNGLDVGVRASTSIGMERRAAAKMVFISGMYCAAGAGEALRIRTRLWRDGVGFRVAVVVVIVGAVGREGVSWTVSLFAFVRASVKAPARAVLVFESAVGAVFFRSVRRDACSEEAIVANGR